jgi:hypothetical protein
MSNIETKEDYMSYEIIKAVSIKADHVSGRSASNNISPRYFEKWSLDNSLTKMLRVEGRDSVIKTILFLYYEGSWKEGTPNTFSKVAWWYSYSKSNYNYGTKPVYSRQPDYSEKMLDWENRIKDELFEFYMRWKDRKKVSVVIQDTSNGYYVTQGITRYGVKLGTMAKVFGSVEEAEGFICKYGLSSRFSITKG